MNFVEIETMILDQIQTIHRPVLDAVMVYITRLGDHGTIWILTAFVFLCTKKYRKGGMVICLALIFSFILGNLIIKNLVARPRPCWVNDTVQLLISVPGDYSFPSAHTMSSFAAATAIFFMNKSWGITALLLAGAIAFSRMYLYVHYPTDILAGAVLGVFVAYAAKWGLPKR